MQPNEQAATTPAEPTENETDSVKAARLQNMALNAALAVIDEKIQTFAESPQTQFSILTLAAALAVRRIIGTDNTRRARRGAICKAAVKDFESKVRRHSFVNDSVTTPSDSN